MAVSKYDHLTSVCLLKFCIGPPAHPEVRCTPKEAYTRQNGQRPMNQSPHQKAK